MSLSDSDFCELMERIKNGDEPAREELIKDAQKIIFPKVKKRLGGGGDVEQVTQNCLISISNWQTLREFREHHSYVAWKTYLDRVAFSKVQDYWRKKKRTPEHVSLDNSEDTDTADRLSEIQVSQARAKDNMRIRYEEVEEAVPTKVSKRDQEIFLGHWREDLSYSELAEEYELSITAVSSIISRAKKHLKAMFNYPILLPSWMRDIMERIAPAKQVALWTMPQVSCVVLSAIILLLAGIEQDATVLSPHRRYAPDWATGVQFYPLTAKKPPLKVPQVNQSGGGESSDSAQKTAVDSQNDMTWDKGSWTQTKGPNGGTITALHAMPDGSPLAGTLLGGIFRLADNGEWLYASKGLYSIPSAISAFAHKGNTIYVGTDDGLHYSTNSGGSWQQLTDGSVSGTAIIGDTIYIARARGALFPNTGILFSNDNGKSWTPFDTGLPDLGAVERLAVFASGTTLFAQTRGIVSDTLVDARKPQTQLIFGQVPRHHVFRRKAGEESWTKLTIQDTWKGNTVESDIIKFIVSGEIVYAVTATGQLFRSTNMGDSWQRITPKVTHVINVKLTAVGNAVFCINPFDGRVFQSTDTGDSWRMFNTNLTHQRILSIAAVSDNTLYVGTQNGVVRSTDGGRSWTKFTTGITDTDSGELISFGKGLWTVTGDGIAKSVDGGDSWVIVNDGLIDNDWVGVAGSEGLLLWAGAKLTKSEGKLYVATCKSGSSYWNPNTSGIYCLAADETLWMPIRTNMPSFDGDRIDVIDRFVSSRKTFYIIARKRIYRWRMGDNFWKDLGLKVLNEEGFAVSAGKTIYVAREDGKLFRSVDEGDTLEDITQRLPNWNLLAQQDYPFPIYDLHFVDEIIYAGTNFGVSRPTDADATPIYDSYYHVSRSTDGGETWESVVDGLPKGNLNLQLVYNTTLYGANADGIFRVRNGANSWQRIAPYRSDVVSLAFDGTTFFIATAKQGVFRLPPDG